MQNTHYLSDIFIGDYPITQRFGENKQYYQKFGLAGHEGVDFGTPVGTPVVAPFDGIVLREGSNIPGYHNYGMVIVIWDPVQKCAVWYGHLSRSDVAYGQKVTLGQKVGATGNTGNSSGPHLHLGFVKTDAYGNRLNTNNGHIGFLDPLDNTLVTWRLGDQSGPNADEYVGRCIDAARSLLNAVEAGMQVKDPLFRTKLKREAVIDYTQKSLTIMQGP